MRLKKYKQTKVLLLKIFIAQQKNKFDLKLKLRKIDLTFLCFLWKSGYILGFTCLIANMYNIFLKKHFKQYSIKFVTQCLNFKTVCLYKSFSIIKTPIIVSSKGLLSFGNYKKNIGGFLLCDLI